MCSPCKSREKRGIFLTVVRLSPIDPLTRPEKSVFIPSNAGRFRDKILYKTEGLDHAIRFTCRYLANSTMVERYVAAADIDDILGIPHTKTTKRGKSLGSYQEFQRGPTLRKMLAYDREAVRLMVEKHGQEVWGGEFAKWTHDHLLPFLAIHAPAYGTFSLPPDLEVAKEKIIQGEFALPDDDDDTKLKSDPQDDVELETAMSGVPADIPTSMVVTEMVAPLGNAILIGNADKRVYTPTRIKFRDLEVRTFLRTTPELERRWVASSICQGLGLSDTHQAVCGRSDRPGSGLDQDEWGYDNVMTPGGPQTCLTVTEAGLFGLIFQSRKPEAMEFKRWLKHDVLPSIRANGYYMQPARIHEVEASSAPINPSLMENAIVVMLKAITQLLDRNPYQTPTFAAQMQAVAHQTIEPLKVIPAGWDRLRKFANTNNVSIPDDKMIGQARVCNRICRRLGVTPIKHQYSPDTMEVNLYPNEVLGIWLDGYSRNEGKVRTETASEESAD